MAGMLSRASRPQGWAKYIGQGRKDEGGVRKKKLVSLIFIARVLLGALETLRSRLVARSEVGHNGVFFSFFRTPPSSFRPSRHAGLSIPAAHNSSWQTRISPWSHT